MISKTIIRLFSISIILIIGVIGCSTMEKTSYPDDSLEAHIEKLSGVRITGSGEYAKVMVSSHKLSGARQGQGYGGKTGDNYRESDKKPPLFIVNGQNVGRDFQVVKDMLIDRDIESAKLLSQSLAFSQYRNESHYGVIEIKTKKKPSQY